METVIFPLSVIQKILIGCSYRVSSTGNTALPVGDYCWNQNGTGWRVVRLGACWSDGLNAGAFCWHLCNASSNRSRYIGGRLVYRKKGCSIAA